MDTGPWTQGVRPCVQGGVPFLEARSLYRVRQGGSLHGFITLSSHNAYTLGIAHYLLLLRHNPIALRHNALALKHKALHIMH